MGGSFPVLMYHALAEQAPAGEHYTLSVAGFRAQLAAIAAAGRVGCALGAVAAGRVAPERAVVLTFDDGNASDLGLALPLLREFGFTATFFLTTAHIGSGARWLDWDGVERLAAAGMEIGAHGHSHRFLDDLDEWEQLSELETPLRLLQSRLGRAPASLSFPGGRYTDFALSQARLLGYRQLCLSRPGLNACEAADALIRRFVIHRGVSARRFARIVTADPLHAAWACAAYAIKGAGKRVLGNRIYYGLWRALFARGVAAQGGTDG
ncbi:MAG TPA: polysaccharide deacetylase family protein [Candidatus Competibacteraceae bacterium]|nr:polysaccharide deacetylase family protein [Candidatus Competibacteraceae bacterium]